jgi:hypothetical protein
VNVRVSVLENDADMVVGLVKCWEVGRRRVTRVAKAGTDISLWIPYSYWFM